MTLSALGVVLAVALVFGLVLLLARTLGESLTIKPNLSAHAPVVAAPVVAVAQAPTPAAATVVVAPPHGAVTPTVVIATPYWTNIRRVAKWLLLVALAAIAVAAVVWGFVATYVYFFGYNWPWVPPSNPLGNDAGLPDLKLDTPATTPWWNQDPHTLDFVSYVPDWWMQALIAVGATLFATLLLIITFRWLRKKFGVLGAILGLLVLAFLVVGFYFTGPHIIPTVKEFPEWAARTWSQILPGLTWVTGWMVLILFLVGCFIALWRSSVSTQEKLVGTAMLGFLFLVGTHALSNYDGSQHGYAGPTNPSASLGSTSTPCLGNGETQTVGPDNWVTINAGFKCHIIFEVVGTEMLLGEPSNYIKAGPGDQVGNVLKQKGVRIISVRTTGGHGYLNYKLHPHGCKENGWECG